MGYEQYLSYAKQTLEEIRAEVGGDDQAMTRAVNARLDKDPEFSKALLAVGYRKLAQEQA
ncbi:MULTISPECIES: hypothetical protein [unclassified Achromobacter]|uniref:hypothetical protein n=1 Tax=unclassified Achromobacter TaxID=2626865 RepID=UPI000B51D83F|nr:MULTISPECIES: hypothetical protein [unclassified Achromobacter]OWT68068.1 hypothetical protein CEY05_28970 [Achromobacter sp. HZ34]OWT69905.1 hypothetical protein CEY04_27800 [Achromobacter sp. HZ28]